MVTLMARREYSRFPASATASENSTQDKRKTPTFLYSILSYGKWNLWFFRRILFEDPLFHKHIPASTITGSALVPFHVTSEMKLSWRPSPISVKTEHRTKKWLFRGLHLGVRKKFQSAATISWPNVDFTAGVELILHHYIMFLLYLKTEHYTVFAEINAPGA